MKSRMRLGSENVMKIDGFADGNAISDLNSEFRRKQAGDYRANQEQTKRETRRQPRGKKPRDNQEQTKKEPRRSTRRRAESD